MTSEKTKYYFVDEAGDMTFFGKGGISIVGTPGVSNHFLIGMLCINENLTEVRRKIEKLKDEVLDDVYFKNIVNIQKKVVNNNQFFFHATDDIPEVRMMFYKLIKSLDCTFELVVVAKSVSRFIHKHNKKESEFYADILSYLLENKLKHPHQITVAKIGSTLKVNHLQDGFKRAIKRVQARESLDSHYETKFIIETQYAEPILNIADYFCWAYQRFVEKRETRYLRFIEEKIKKIWLPYFEEEVAEITIKKESPLED